MFSNTPGTVETHKTSNICVCPASGIMNAGQKEEFKALFTNFLTTIKGALAKEAYKTNTHLDSLQNMMIDQKAINYSWLAARLICGRRVSVVGHDFRHIVKLNNW